MTRDELLQELAKTKFCAVPTVQTMDMGIEFDFVDEHGTGTVFGAFGEWPLWRLRSIPGDTLANIQAKLKEGSLVAEDIAGTDLQLLYEECSRFQEVSVIDFLCGLSNIKSISDKYFWCLCDARCHGPEAQFFQTKEELFDCFQRDYCSGVDAWDSFDDEELENWLARIQDVNDLGQMGFCYFGDDDKEQD